MAFPTTSVKDSFTRADGAIGANYSNPIFTGDATIRVASNQAAPGSDDSGTAYAAEYWSVATFGPDSEIYLTVATKGSSASSGGMELLLRLTGLDGTPSGYSLFGNHSQSGSFSINRYDNGTFTQLGASITQAVTDGDAYGLEAIGSTLKAYRKPSAGAWAQIGTSRTDATYSAAGNIGFELQESAAGATGHRGDDFGGGTVVTGGGSQALAATIAAQSAFTSVLTDKKLLAATIAAQSGVAGALSIAKRMQALIAAGSSVTAALTDAKRLAAQINGVSVVTASATDKKLLAAAIAGQSQVVAALSGGAGQIVVTSRDGQNAVIHVVTNR